MSFYATLSISSEREPQYYCPIARLHYHFVRFITPKLPYKFLRTSRVSRWRVPAFSTSLRCFLCVRVGVCLRVSHLLSSSPVFSFNRQELFREWLLFFYIKHIHRLTPIVSYTYTITLSLPHKKIHPLPQSTSRVYLVSGKEKTTRTTLYSTPRFRQPCHVCSLLSHTRLPPPPTPVGVYHFLLVVDWTLSMAINGSRITDVFLPFDWHVIDHDDDG